MAGSKFGIKELKQQLSYHENSCDDPKTTVQLIVRTHVMVQPSETASTRRRRLTYYEYGNTFTFTQTHTDTNIYHQDIHKCADIDNT